MAKADIEYQYRDQYGNPAMVNGGFNEEEATIPEKEAIETTLSVRGLEARVITYTGDYLKVKWYLNKKPYQVYKMKGYNQTEVLAFINAIADYDDLPADV